MRVRRVALVAGAVVVGWLVLLVVLGVALGARQERHTRERLGESLQGDASIGSFDLALVRGALTMENVAVKRDDVIGHMALTVDGVRCDLLPVGLALFDHDCGELAVHGMRLEVSTAAVFKQRAAPHRPIHADRLVIDDATLVFLPSAVMPSVGAIEISLEHAESGPSTLRTPLSWLFALRELRARFTLPAGIVIRVEYRDGLLRASGSLLGSRPVEIPLVLPVADAAQDAHDEMKLLFETGRKAAERLVAQRANDWLRSKIR